MWFNVQVVPQNWPKSALPILHVNLFMVLPGSLVRWTDGELWMVMILNACIPFGCILIAQWESTNHMLKKLCGTARRAVVAFSLVIVLLTLQANLIYSGLVRSQLHLFILQDNRILWSGYCLLICGTILIYKAFRALGFYATFYGSYFGVNGKQKVTEFPYNFLTHPMYVGSTLNHLGFAMIFASQAGLVVTVTTALAYTIVAHYESALRQNAEEAAGNAKKKS